MPAHLVRRNTDRPALRPLATLILGLLAGNAAQAVDIPFDNGTVIDSTTNRGFSTAFADIDGDGDLDLLSAVSTPNNSVSWWENVNGSFGTPQTEHVVMATWTGATSVAAGDVDGDGDLDVLAAAFDLGDIVVFRNDGGTGTSWSALDVDLAVPGPRQAIFADLDRDGDLDVVGGINGIGTNDVSWWQNTAGDGSAWTRRTIDQTMNGARSVGVGDIDGDGDPDVVASAEFDDKVVFYENTAGTALTWTETQVNTALFDGGSTLTLADFDGDGDLDVAAVAEEAANVVFWRNSAGDGSSWAEVMVSPSLAGAYGISSGDMDADGDLDLVTAGRASLRIDWWENTAGDGSAWTGRLVESFAVGSNGRSVAVGDADGDGLLDIAASLDSRLELYHNDSIHHSLTFPARQDVDTSRAGAYDVDAVDLDSDGDLDLVGAAATADAVVFYENSTGDGSTFAPTTVASFDGATAVAWGDVDLDGAIDLVGAADTAGDLVYWHNAAGDGSSWTATTIDANFPGARDIELADIDGDGDLDAVAASTGGDEIAFYRNANGDGSVWQKLTPGTFFVDASAVAAGDLDGDGDLDLVAAAAGDDDISWFENLGTGEGSSWTEHSIATAFDGAADVALADIDGDGDLDVVAAAEGADTVAFFENVALAFTQHDIDTGFDGARGVAVADIDADGFPDVVAGRGNGTGGVQAYRNLAGAGLVWTPVALSSSFAGGARLAIADVDGDGRLDVAAAAATAGTIALFRNGGGQAALPTTNVSPGSLGNGVTQAVLRLQLLHRGQPGETAVELASLRLRFEDSGQDALTSAEANGIVDNLRLYLDDGNNAFDGGDVLVHTEATLALTGGAQTLSLVDGDVNVGVSQGSSKTYFVVVQTTVDYTAQALGFFRIVHLNGESVTEDRINDSVLRLEEQPDVATNLFQVNPTAESADLALQSIVDAPDPVIAGTQLTYTVTVRNDGPSAAENVTVAGTLPAGVTLVSTSGCANDPSGSPTCNLGTVANGATPSFTITALVSSAQSAALSFSATVSSTTAEAGPGDETASATTSVVRQGDLVLDLSQPPRDYVDNAPIRYLIQISNTGPSDSSAATVTDTFPALLTGVTWTCSGTGGSTCPASGNGNLAAVAISVRAGQSVTFVATGNVPDNTTTPIVNTASVADVNDPDGSDNSDSVTSPWSNPIFLDGFESGTFSAWSSHVP